MDATAPPLGWPWDALAEAVERRQDAERFAQQALELGAPGDRRRAEWELEEALRQERWCRDELAGVFLLMLGEALKHRPGALLLKFHDVALEHEWKDFARWLCSSKPGGHRWNAGLDERVRQAERRAAEAAQRKAESWRLAVALAQLEERVAELERANNAGNAGQGHADTRQGDGSQARREAG